MAFKKASKKDAKLRMAIDGPSGSGKTYTSLKIASRIAGDGGKVAVIDSERGSASKYADLFNFDVDELESFHPDAYINSINDAVKNGYNVLIIDSLSHAWMGKDGVLEQVDKISARSNAGNSFSAWKDGTKLQNKLIDAILKAHIHIIVTMRSKTDYIMETNDKGKNVPKKIGMAPIQRDGLEYEFDVVGDMDQSNNLIVSKTRCPILAGAVIEKPGDEIAEKLLEWLSGDKQDSDEQIEKWKTLRAKLNKSFLEAKSKSDLEDKASKFEDYIKQGPSVWQERTRLNETETFGNLYDTHKDRVEKEEELNSPAGILRWVEAVLSSDMQGMLQRINEFNSQPRLQIDQCTIALDERAIQLGFPSYKEMFPAQEEEV